MKGAFKGYFNMPNVGRLRTRVVNPDKDLTPKIREKVMQVIAETINENALSIKAKLADFVVNECGLQFKDKAAEAQVAAVTGNIFDIYAGSTPEALAALTGEEVSDKEDPADPADDQEAAAADPEDFE